MTTNPSTGLPEELEKAFIPSWVERGTSEYTLANEVINKVLDWACKKVCPECAKGNEPTYDHFCGWWHPELRHTNNALCAASVLREGK